mgnify:CR=1 FL=1
MSAENLERKANAILGEFASTNDMKEATECVAEEVPEAKHGEFVAAIMRRVLDMRPNQRLGPLGLLEYIARVGAVPNTAFVAGFTEILDELTDLCIDDPQANIFVGKFIGRLAAAGAFEPANGGSGPSSGSTAAASKYGGAKARGLGFLSTAVGKLQEENARTTLQLVCAVFSGFKQGLLSPPVGPPPDTPNKPAAASEVEADAVSRGVCQALGLDVTALAKAIGDRGDMALQSALDALGVQADGGARDTALRDAVIGSADASRARQKALDRGILFAVIASLFEQDLAREPGARWRDGTLLGLDANKLHIGLDGMALDVKLYREDLEGDTGTAWRFDTVSATAADERDGYVLGDGVRVRVARYDAVRERYALQIVALGNRPTLADKRRGALKRRGRRRPGLRRRGPSAPRG